MEGRMLFYLRYYLELAKYNLFISILGGWFGTSLDRPFLDFFLISYLSVGSVGSIYFFHYFQENEYYFYFNKGFSKARLNLTTNVVNIIFCPVLFFIFHKVQWL